MAGRPAAVWRFDERGDGKDTRWQATWGLRLPGHHPVWSEYLILAYDLRQRAGDPTPVLHKPDMTHEFMLFAVDPKTEIRFGVSMFEQPEMAPLTPANMAYQFAALDCPAAKLRLGTCVRSLVNWTLSPDTDYRAAWDKLFADGVGFVSQR